MMQTADPDRYPRRVLCAVTGLSPQVVTETLYHLAVKSVPRFVPTEIRLITTRQGAENARLNLLSEQRGWFHRLVRDYKLPAIAFDASRIHVLSRPDDTPLDDIRTPADNEHAANSITELVRELTSDAQSSLHVSIAGGRKTMGYYLGYALSLFGREQDRLSHVLISAPFENNPEFYYPTPYEYPVNVRHEGRELASDCRNAQVELADIPFVRLRDGQSEALRSGKIRFYEAVSNAQRALPSVSLILNCATRTLVAGGEAIVLRPAEFAFYWLIAQKRLEGEPGIHWSDEGIDEALSARYRCLVHPGSGYRDRNEKSPIQKSTFNARKSHIARQIVKALGERRAKPYLIASQEVLGSGTRQRCRRYTLELPADRIIIDGANPTAIAAGSLTP